MAFRRKCMGHSLAAHTGLLHWEIGLLGVYIISTSNSKSTLGMLLRMLAPTLDYVDSQDSSQSLSALYAAT